MKKPGLIVLGLAILVCGGGGYLYLKMQAAKAKQTGPDTNIAKVEKGDLLVQVVETGTVDAVKNVEAKSRVAGRLLKLLVDEGSTVHQGELIAVIDPQESELRVRQDEAQLKGAQSAVARTDIEIAQRRITAQVALEQAQKRLEQLEKENAAQPSLTRSAIDAAQSAANSAQQALEQLERTTQPNERTQAQNALQEAQYTADQAQRELDRREGLLAKGFISRREFEDGRLQYELAGSRLKTAQDRVSRLATQQALELKQAQERVRQARAELTRAQTNRYVDAVKSKELETARLQVRQARAALKDVDALVQSKYQGQASVDQIASVLGDSRRQLRETEIRAPFDGVVTKRYVEVGDLITALSPFSPGTPIVRIEDRTVLRVIAAMNEIDVARIHEGMGVDVEIDAIPGAELKGKVKRIGQASIATGSQTAASGQSDAVVKYQVEIYLEPNKAPIRTGMSAKCRLDVLKREGVLRLPVAFVGKDNRGSYVMLPSATKGGKPTRKDIKAGTSTGAWVEVLDGLKLGETVVRPPFTGPERTGFIQTGDGQ